jgi:hypothetical protein
MNKAILNLPFDKAMGTERERRQFYEATQELMTESLEISRELLDLKQAIMETNADRYKFIRKQEGVTLIVQENGDSFVPETPQHVDAAVDKLRATKEKT